MTLCRGRPLSDVGLVLLDYIDYLVVDKSFEKFDEAYRRLAMAAKATVSFSWWKYAN